MRSKENSNPPENQERSLFAVVTSETQIKVENRFDLF